MSKAFHAGAGGFVAIETFAAYLNKASTFSAFTFETKAYGDDTIDAALARRTSANLSFPPGVTGHVRVCRDIAPGRARPAVPVS